MLGIQSGKKVSCVSPEPTRPPMSDMEMQEGAQGPGAAAAKGAIYKPFDKYLKNSVSALIGYSPINGARHLQPWR